MKIKTTLRVRHYLELLHEERLAEDSAHEVSRLFGPSGLPCGWLGHGLYVKRKEKNFEAQYTKLSEATIATSGTVWTVKWYHAPFSLAYDKILQGVRGRKRPRAPSYSGIGS